MKPKKETKKKMVGHRKYVPSRVQVRFSPIIQGLTNLAPKSSFVLCIMNVTFLKTMIWFFSPPTKSKATWHVQRFQSMKYLDLKHMLSIIFFSFWITLFLFRGMCKTILPTPVTEQTKAIAVDGTAIKQNRTRAFQSCRQLSEWSNMQFRFVHGYITLCEKGSSTYFRFRWWTGKIRRNHIELTQSHHISIYCIPPCTISSVKRFKNIHLLFWAGSTFIGLNMEHMLTRKICSTHITKKKMTLAYRSNMTPPRNTLNLSRNSYELATWTGLLYLIFLPNTLNLHLIYAKIVAGEL
jgi:hypothetical protein